MDTIDPGESVDPYAYQERVFDALMAGENVILKIPTGGGKTRASLLPFLHDRAFGDGLLPEKALYVTPMRVLAAQFLATANQLYLHDLNPALFVHLEATYQRFGRDLFAIQTGDAPNDPQFESMITACTIDQLLSGVAGIPYGLNGKKANMNVGAVCGAYLILDEPHLYPLSQDGKSYKGAFTTTLEVLRQLKGLTRFVFMSATLSDDLVTRLSKMLDATVIALNDDELVALNRERRRTFSRATCPLNARQVLDQHQNCSLVVCNTVQRAQELYLQLWEELEREGKATRPHLLHSLYTDEDRKKQGDELTRLLGKDQWDKGRYLGEQDVIVVATQVVEVGLDISVQTLHTELAPANSLVQRAGRCARFEKQQGQVIIYPAIDEEGKPLLTLPYNEDVCQSTWQALEPFDGRVMGFREEQQLINQVHTAADLKLLDRYEEHRGEFQEAITLALQGDRSRMTDMIRDVNQIQLVINDNPKDEMKIRPWRWQSFGLRPSTLMGRHWEALIARKQQHFDAGWWQARQQEQQQLDDQDDHRLPVTYEWDPITAPHQLPGALLIAMSQELVTYDKELGLVFLDGRLEERIALPATWRKRLAELRYQSPQLSPLKRSSDDTQTQAQSYKEHIRGLAGAYHYGIYEQMHYVMHKLEALMHLEMGTIDHAIQLAIFAHDLGKLDSKWQRWARAWQQLVHTKEQWNGEAKTPAKDYCFAKTNYDYTRKEQIEWQKELAVQGIKRPNHACESVRVSRAMIFASLGVDGEKHPNYPVARAVCSAIAHHHTPTAHEYGQTVLREQAKIAIKEAFDEVCLDGGWSYTPDKLLLSFDGGDLNSAKTVMMTVPELRYAPEKCYETWLSFLIVRALRLADQRADIYRLRR